MFNPKGESNLHRKNTSGVSPLSEQEHRIVTQETQPQFFFTEPGILMYCTVLYHSVVLFNSHVHSNRSSAVQTCSLFQHMSERLRRNQLEVLRMPLRERTCLSGGPIGGSHILTSGLVLNAGKSLQHVATVPVVLVPFKSPLKACPFAAGVSSALPRSRDSRTLMKPTNFVEFHPRVNLNSGDT